MAVMESASYHCLFVCLFVCLLMNMLTARFIYYKMPPQWLLHLFQTLGKVIGLPQPFVAHVAMDSVPGIRTNLNAYKITLVTSVVELLTSNPVIFLV